MLGKYYAARHKHGHYRSSAVTARYCFHTNLLSHPEDRFTQLLRHALKSTIKRHPALSYGITEKTEESEAHFMRQEAIKWEDVVEFHSSLLDSGSLGEDVVLCRLLNIGHKHLWKSQSTRPAWKIIVLRHGHEPSSEISKVDVLFLCHHALGDGLSGAAFQKTLLEFLYEASLLPDLNDEWPIIILPTIGKLIHVEQFLHFPPETKPKITKDLNTTNTDSFALWTGGPISLPPMDEVNTLIQMITIPEAQVRDILQTCRRLTVTLTGLLHGLITIYLSRTLNDAHGFRSVTPYSMRRFTQLSADEMVNHISFILSDLSEPLITAARQASNSTKEEKVISWVSKQLQAEITDELLRVPTEGSDALIEISRIKDLDKFCEDGMKRKRGYTYELSNIGAIKLPEKKTTGTCEIKLESLVFTQCAMVVGPAFGCSVVSVRGSALTISLHWQEGIVENGLMDGLREFLKGRLMGMTG